MLIEKLLQGPKGYKYTLKKRTYLPVGMFDNVSKAIYHWPQKLQSYYYSMIGSKNVRSYTTTKECSPIFKFHFCQLLTTIAKSFFFSNCGYMTTKPVYIFLLFVIELVGSLDGLGNKQKCSIFV